METALQNQNSESIAACERTRGGGCYSPRFDIVETADELTLFGDLPGVRTDDLEIRFENQELVIHGKVASRAKAEDRHLVREYGVGDFYRAFTISEGVDSQRIHAELKNGVLALHLPKAEAIKPRRIEVHVG